MRSSRPRRWRRARRRRPRAPGASPGSAFNAELNAFDLLDVGAQVANGVAGVTLNPLVLSVPGVASISAKLKIIEPAKIAIGYPGHDASGNWNTEVHTSQVRMELNVKLLGVLGLLGSKPVALDIFVEAAQT